MIELLRHPKDSDEDKTVLPADVGIFINPKFVKSSRKREEMDEGCLSVRGIYGTPLFDTIAQPYGRKMHQEKHLKEVVVDFSHKYFSMKLIT